MKRSSRVALLLLPSAAVVLMLLLPMLRLAAEGWGESFYESFFAVWEDDFLKRRLVWSFAQAFLTCALAFIFGLPVAWVLARFEFPGRQLVLRLLMLPFVVPTLVAALGVLALWGPQGVFSQALGIDLQDTPWLLLYGNLFFNLCLVIRAGVDALGQVNAHCVAASRSLGATPWRAFWRVEWPVIAPWLTSSLCLVFLYCFSGFGLALVLGGQRYATVEVEIYTLVAYELKLAEASSLALWMLVLTGLVALAYAYVEKRLSVATRLHPIALRFPKTALHWLAVFGSIAVLFFFCAAPIMAIAWRALQADSQAWAALLDAETLQALWNTLRFSAAALFIATVLGVAHALGSDIRTGTGTGSGRGSVFWRAAAYLPLIASPVTVAFGLLLLYPDWTASLALLIAAYAVLAYPFVAKAMTAGLGSLPDNLNQVARTLGASPVRTFWRVTLPLLSPALRRGMAFATATALGEFAVTLFLSRPEWTTLTTLIYQRLGKPGAVNLDAAMLLACLLMLLSALVFVVIDSQQKTSESKTIG
jgi:thiamine transport system permease protein